MGRSGRLFLAGEIGSCLQSAVRPTACSAIEVEVWAARLAESGRTADGGQPVASALVPLAIDSTQATARALKAAVTDSEMVMLPGRGRSRLLPPDSVWDLPYPGRTQRGEPGEQVR